MFPPSLELTTSLRAYLKNPEFRNHYRHHPASVIDRVLRYGAPLGSLIEQHEILPRCMGRIKEMIASAHQENHPLPSGTVVIARELRDGCGRFDREWFAPSGGLWMAVAWADSLLPEYARLLPLAAGTASCEAIRSFGVDAAVKWVNDIHIHGRKIGGVLCETLAGQNPEDRYHLIGIGINCNNISFPASLQGNATSIAKELCSTIDRDRFILELLARLTWNFGLVHLHEEQSLAREMDGDQGVQQNLVLSAWKRLSDTPGRRVVYGYDVVRKPLYRATVKGIDDSGGLVMQMENGAIVTENSGEIIYLEGGDSN